MKTNFFSGVVRTPLLFLIARSFLADLADRSMAPAGTRSAEPGPTSKAIQRANGTPMKRLRLAVLATVFVHAAGAQTCSPVNFPAITVQGQTFQSAIVNGVQASNIGKTEALFQWTSDAAANNVTGTYAIFVTAAQWAANGNSFGSTPNKTVTGGGTTSSTQLQGAVLTNLIPNTTYHVAGQSVTGAGTCPISGTQTTFTTNPWNGITPPAPPNTMSLTRPALNGTHWTVGGACATLQACINVAQPGDDIILPAGVTQTVSNLTFPRTGQYTIPYSWPVSETLSTSTFTLTCGGCTTSSLGLTNGTPIILNGGPSPINQGFGGYSVVNASGANFQISLDGANPVTLVDTGGSPFYVMKWPISQPYIVIHSGASTANLPPAGVRLDPVAYGSQLGIVSLASAPGNIANVGDSSNYWWEDIEFTAAPSAAPNQTDPVPYYNFITLNPEANNWVFDQCWFHPPPAPDRIENVVNFGGTGIAFIDNYFDNNGFWKAMTQCVSACSSTSGTSVTIGAQSYSYAVSGNTKAVCTLASSPTLTATGSGTSSLQFIVYFTVPGCVLTAQAQTGLTLSGSGFTIAPTTSGPPPWPTDGSGVIDVLEIGGGTWNYNGGSPSIGYGNSATPAMPTAQGISEANTGLQYHGGAGPFEFINNYFIGGGGILGFPYFDEYGGSGCTAGITTPCQQNYNTADLTVQRNTVAFDPHYILSNALWNGSWWFGRNGLEQKQLGRVNIDGNIVGPIYAGVANGECQLIFEYFGGFPSAAQSWPDTMSTSDISYTNNTCVGGGGIAGGGGNGGGNNPENLMRRIRVHNNLFFVNEWTYNPNPTTTSAPAGVGISMSAIEDLEMDHNDFVYQSGPYANSWQSLFSPTGGWDFSNNIAWTNNQNSWYDLLFSGQGGYCSTGSTGTCYYQNPCTGCSPAGSMYGQYGSALLANLNQATANNNLWICGYSDSSPASQTPIAASTCSTYPSLYPASNSWITTGSTIAARVAQIPWYTPGSYASPQTGDYHLVPSSANNSGGAKRARDGLAVGADVDALEAAQGNVSNVHVSALGATTAAITWLAPDSYACTLDYGTANFASGSGAWTRVASTATGPGGARVQTASLTGLASGTTYYFRANCAAMQPAGTFQTP